MKTSRKHLLFFWLSLVIIFGGVGVLIYQHQQSRPQQPQTQAQTQKSPQYRLRIQGFQFDGHVEGKRVIRIQAD